MYWQHHYVYNHEITTRHLRPGNELSSRPYCVVGTLNTVFIVFKSNEKFVTFRSASQLFSLLVEISINRSLILLTGCYLLSDLMHEKKQLCSTNSSSGLSNLTFAFTLGQNGILSVTVQGSPNSKG